MAPEERSEASELVCSSHDTNHYSGRFLDHTEHEIESDLDIASLLLDRSNSVNAFLSLTEPPSIKHAPKHL